MRREYKQEESYIDWLKSIGCIMYLPLSDNDLQDKITGEYLQLTDKGSMEWDSTEQMYKFTQPSSYWQSVAYIDNGINKNTFPDDDFTTINTIKKIDSSNSKNILSMSPNSKTSGDTMSSLQANYNASGKTSGFPDGIANVAYSNDHTNRNRRFYQQGELFNSYAEYQAYFPSNWVISGSGILIANTKGDSSHLNVRYYMKEVYLFNKALDLTTIRKIQGYE